MRLFLLSVITGFIFITGISSAQQTPYTRNVNYFVPVQWNDFTATQQNPYLHHLPITHFKNFVQILFNVVKDGTVPVIAPMQMDNFDYTTTDFNWFKDTANYISDETERKSLLSITTQGGPVYHVDEEGNYFEHMDDSGNVIYQYETYQYSYADVVGYRFFETWQVDPKQKTITKEVKALSCYIMVKDPETLNRSMKQLFTLVFKPFQESENAEIICSRISSNVSFKENPEIKSTAFNANDKSTWTSFFSGLNKKQIYSGQYPYVLNSKIKTGGPFYFPKTGYDNKIQGQGFELANMQGVCFYESWSINPELGCFSKKVRGLAPYFVEPNAKKDSMTYKTYNRELFQREYKLFPENISLVDIHYPFLYDISGTKHFELSKQTMDICYQIVNYFPRHIDTTEQHYSDPKWYTTLDSIPALIRYNAQALSALKDPRMPFYSYYDPENIYNQLPVTAAAYRIPEELRASYLGTHGPQYPTPFMIFDEYGEPRDSMRIDELGNEVLVYPERDFYPFDSSSFKGVQLFAYWKYDPAAKKLNSYTNYTVPCVLEDDVVTERVNSYRPTIVFHNLNPEDNSKMLLLKKGVRVKIPHSDGWFDEAFNFVPTPSFENIDPQLMGNFVEVLLQQVRNGELKAYYGFVPAKEKAITKKNLDTLLYHQVVHYSVKKKLAALPTTFTTMYITADWYYDPNTFTIHMVPTQLHFVLERDCPGVEIIPEVMIDEWIYDAKGNVITGEDGNPIVKKVLQPEQRIPRIFQAETILTIVLGS